MEGLSLQSVVTISIVDILSLLAVSLSLFVCLCPPFFQRKKASNGHTESGDPLCELQLIKASLRSLMTQAKPYNRKEAAVTRFTLGAYDAAAPEAESGSAGRFSPSFDAMLSVMSL